jgi:hypothetical protein
VPQLTQAFWADVPTEDPPSLTWPPRATGEKKSSSRWRPPWVRARSSRGSTWPEGRSSGSLQKRRDAYFASLPKPRVEVPAGAPPGQATMINMGCGQCDGATFNGPCGNIGLSGMNFDSLAPVIGMVGPGASRGSGPTNSQPFPQPSTVFRPDTGHCIGMTARSRPLGATWAYPVSEALPRPGGPVYAEVIDSRLLTNSTASIDCGSRLARLSKPLARNRETKSSGLK